MQRVHTYPITSVSAGDDGNTLPQSVIDVNDNVATAGFASSGTIWVQTDSGIQAVTYTGIGTTSFTGCSGGVGEIHTDYTVSAEDELKSADLNQMQDSMVGTVQLVGKWLGREPSMWSTDNATINIDANVGMLLQGQFIPTYLQRTSGILPAFGPAICTTATTTLATSALTASTWYYVYAFQSAAGVMSFEYSSTAPDPATAYTFKTNDLTRRYLTCFFSNASSQVQSFRRRAGLYEYNSYTSTVGWVGALTNGTAATMTDVSLAGALPPHSRQAILLATLGFTSANTDARILLRVKGASSALWDRLVQTNRVSNTNDALQDMFPIETDATQTIQYSVTSPAKCSLAVIGFYE